MGQYTKMNRKQSTKPVIHLDNGVSSQMHIQIQWDKGKMKSSTHFCRLIDVLARKQTLDTLQNKRNA